MKNFQKYFKLLTGEFAFPWQIAFYERFIAGDIPKVADIPTGLGKTSIVAIWLSALMLHPDRVPRRLVYVVNRRTVVDQTTSEVVKLRKKISENPELAEKLCALCALPAEHPLAISTLRGQFADNREWSVDPTRPAVIIGTVDMIGSGLLFSRYTVGFKLRPHHAAFLAQDALLVHDEAHLEPAFQFLLNTLVAEQAHGDDRQKDKRRLHVVELSATTRSTENASKPPFVLTDADEQNVHIQRRLFATKKLSFAEIADEKAKTLQEKLVELASARSDSKRAVLIFVRSVEVVTQVVAELRKKNLRVASLTGTMRGKERDELVSKNEVFQRFLPEKDRADGITPAEGTVYLVATSAGEVGINISADDLICDLSTYESMAQRFGRVNRFGERDDSTVTVVHPEKIAYEEDEEKRKKTDWLEFARARTLDILKALNGNASPQSLRGISAAARAVAFSPPPEIRVATEVQFDAWALTSIREPIAARPPVAPYLHGESEWEPPETQVAWRRELDVFKKYKLTSEDYSLEDLLEDFPLKPSELLRDTSARVRERLGEIVQRKLNELINSDKKTDGSKLSRQKATDQLPNAWLIREDGSIVSVSLAQFAEKDSTDAAENLLHNNTLILPLSIGGLSKEGLLSSVANSDLNPALDVSEQVLSSNGTVFRKRVESDVPDISPEDKKEKFRLLCIIDTKRAEEDLDKGDDADGTGETEESEAATDAASTVADGTPSSGVLKGRYWLWLESNGNSNGEKRYNIGPPVLLAKHTDDVVTNARAIVEKIFPVATSLGADEPDWRKCIILAARFHDSGKDRSQWQRGIGNTNYPTQVFAKSGYGMRSRDLADAYRHEFGSLHEIEQGAEFKSLSPLERDIVLHLIAAHHGRARPHFPSAEICDEDTTSRAAVVARATEIPRRFARLQRRYGRWGLAWLESLLRSADYAASASTNNSETTNASAQP